MINSFVQSTAATDTVANGYQASSAQLGSMFRHRFAHQIHYLTILKTEWQLQTSQNPLDFPRHRRHQTEGISGSKNITL